jgi:hypothetical protein
MNPNERTNPKATTTRRSAALTIAVIGAIHLALANEYLSETRNLGLMFIAGGIASLYVAIRLWQARDIVAWMVGAVVAAGMFLGFILSRTVGLPGGFHESEWELSGIASLLLEAMYIAALGLWLRQRTRRWTHEAKPRRLAEAAERRLPDPVGGSRPQPRVAREGIDQA